MSYILEALKRSEQERKQQLRPGSFDPEGGILHLRKRQTPVWVYLLVIVLLLNLGLMLGLYWDKLYWDKLTAPEQPVVNETAAVIQRLPTVQAPVIETPAIAAMPTRRPPDVSSTEDELSEALPAAHVNFSETESYTYIEPADQAEPGAAAGESLQAEASQDGVISDETEAWDIVAPASGQTAPARVQVDAPVRTAPTAVKPVKTVPAKPPMLADTTPLLQELDAGFTSSVPAIAFNSHIFSQTPDARRVMINNIYLRQGEGFSGLTVLEIGEEYVVFDKQGRHFKLPVMKDWNP
jgi:general secretion pathway protein B